MRKFNKEYSLQLVIAFVIITVFINNTGYCTNLFTEFHHLRPSFINTNRLNMNRGSNGIQIIEKPGSDLKSFLTPLQQERFENLRDIGVPETEAYNACKLSHFQLAKFLQLIDVEKWGPELAFHKANEYENKKMEIKLQAIPDWLEILRDPRSPEEFLSYVVQWAQEKNVPFDEQEAKSLISKARTVRDDLEKEISKCISRFDSQFGGGNYNVACILRGMRDFSLILRWELTHRGRWNDIMDIPCSSDFFFNFFKKFDITKMRLNKEKKQILKPLFARMGLNGEDILRSQKPTVIIDTGQQGSILRDILELICQSLKGAESDRAFSERILEEAKNQDRDIIAIFGDGDLGLLEMLENKIKEIEGPRPRFSWRAEKQKRLEIVKIHNHHPLNSTGYFGPNLHSILDNARPRLDDMVKQKRVIFVCADTDPKRVQTEFLRGFFKTENALFIHRNLTSEQENLRKLLHLRLLYSLNRNIPQLIHDSSLVWKMEESPKPIHKIQRIGFDSEKLIPRIHYVNPEKQLASLIWVYTLLHPTIENSLEKEREFRKILPLEMSI